jgi:hypothetical protein
MATYITNITIAEKTLNEIKKAIGYPVIQSEYDFVMDEDAIKDYIIGPALEEYFQYFPILENRELASAGSNSMVTIDAPDNTFGIFRHQFIPQSSGLPTNNLMNQGIFYDNPFASANNVLTRGGAGGSSFGTPFSYDRNLHTYQNRFYAKSIEAMNKVYFWEYHDDTNKLDLKASIPGAWYIQFAKFSNNVDSIPLRKRQSFIRYAQGMLMKQFSFILGLTNGELPVQINYDMLEDKGEKLVEESITYWRESSMIPTIR